MSTEQIYHYPVPSYGKQLPLSNAVYQSRPPSSFSEASSASSASTDLYASTDDEIECRTARPTGAFPSTILRKQQSSVPWPAEPLLYYSKLLHGPPEETGMLGREIPKWKRILEVLVTCGDDKFLAIPTTTNSWAFTLASAVLTAPDPWTTMIEMVKNLLWKATNPKKPLSEAQFEAVALVTVEVGRVLKDKPGQPLRSSYRDLLADIFVGTFISAWDNRRNPEGITYHPKPTEALVMATYRLAHFIAKLWQRKVLRNNELEDCFSVLLTSFKSHEHAQVLEMLLVHAGPNYWLSSEAGPTKLLQMADIMDGLHYRIRGTSSVLGNSRGDEDVEKQLRSIAKLCRDWVGAYHRQAYQHQVVVSYNQGMQHPAYGRPPGL